MDYGVHIYAVCRVKVDVSQCLSQEEAVEKANAMDMNELFGPSYADEVVDFLVDEPNDPEYRRSRVWRIGRDGKPTCRQEGG